MKLIKYIIFLFIFVIVGSCGEQSSGTSRSIASTRESLSTEIKNLDSNQLNIAYRVCLSFKSKRNNWHLNSIIGKSAKISYEEKTCDDTQSTITQISPDPVISAPTLSSQITFSSLSEIRFFKNVQTDMHGDLKFTCPTVLQNENVLNFYVEESNKRVYTVFEKLNDTTDRLTLKYTIKSVDGESFISYKVVTMDIKTSNVDDYLIGTVGEITSSRVCSLSSSTSADHTIKQILGSIL